MIDVVVVRDGMNGDVVINENEGVERLLVFVFDVVILLFIL
jgi:hypothetical protein